MINPLVEAIGAGPFLMVQCLSYILFGILIAQIYYYWLMYKDDTVFLRRYIMGIGILAICHSAFSLAMIYDYYINSFGDVWTGLLHIDWEARASIIVQIVFVVMTQGLYVARIWKLSHHSIVITSVPAFLLFCRAACSVANTVFVCINNSWVVFSNEWRSRLTINMTFVVAVLTDAVTSSMLVYYLLSSRSSVKTTTDSVHRLMLYIVNTGAITIVFSLTLLLVFNLVRDNLVFGALYLMHGKVYANTMLAMLNARRTVFKPINGFNNIDLSDRHTHTHIQIYRETVLDISESGGSDTLTPDSNPELSSTDVKSDPGKTETYSIA